MSNRDVEGFGIKVRLLPATDTRPTRAVVVLPWEKTQSNTYAYTTRLRQTTLDMNVVSRVIAAFMRGRHPTVRNFTCTAAPFHAKEWLVVIHDIKIGGKNDEKGLF